MGAKPLSRRQAHIEEAICMGGGVVFIVASFFIVHPLATVSRVAAAFMLVCGYLSSVRVRISDTYRLWPATETAWSEWRPVRTVRTTIGFYGFVVLMVVLFFAVVIWVRG